MKQAKLLSIFFALILLSGCASDGVSDFSAGETAGIYEGEFKIWDAETVRSLFLPDFDSLSEEDFTEFLEEDSSVRIKDGMHNTYFLYETVDDRELFFDAGVIMYDDGALENYRQYLNYGNIAANYTEERMREAYPLKEIEGLSSEEALKMAQDIIDSLEISDLAEPQIYTCTGTVMYDDLAFSYPNLEVPEGIPDKDVYYIYYPGAFEGHKFPTETTTWFKNRDYEGFYSIAEFIISTDGLEHFYTDYISENRKVDECTICTKSEAAETIQNSIGRAKEEGEVSFSDGVLTYVSDGDIETGTNKFYPAWQFLKTVDYEDGSGQFNRFYYVNAATGDLMD